MYRETLQYLQQFRDDRKNLRVTDVDGVVPVGFPLVADVAQVKDGRQQAEDPKQQQVQEMFERCHT